MNQAATFDDILKRLQEVLAVLPYPSPLVINRDLNGRVRFIVNENFESNSGVQLQLAALATRVHEVLGGHAFPAERAVLFESDLDALLAYETAFELEGCAGVSVIDRLATDCNWSSVAPVSTGAPRVVFYSIKGGVGRSTALAALSWALAEQGKRVLILDLDLESPGLSSSLLPEDRRPQYGIADWLVEDLVGNGGTVFESMLATSELSRNGEILVVPAHGANPGEYIAKLGRVWMPKVDSSGNREIWSVRLNRLLNDLEARWSPDVILIDSRAGIDEVASACITDLGASMILLFAIDGDQTWSGYRVLFQHWLKTGVVRDIRKRLQIVGAMIPEVGAQEYFEGLLERAWDTFADGLYDEVPAGSLSDEEGIWSFDATDEGAPHYTWAISWHRGFAALRSLHGRLHEVNNTEVMSTFGAFISGVVQAIETERGEK